MAQQSNAREGAWPDAHGQLVYVLHLFGKVPYIEERAMKQCADQISKLLASQCSGEFRFAVGRRPKSSFWEYVVILSPDVSDAHRAYVRSWLQSLSTSVLGENMALDAKASLVVSQEKTLERFSRGLLMYYAGGA